MNNVSLCWCLSPNFGDALVPWLVERLGHRPVYFAPEWKGRKVFLGGSILNWAQPGDVVWGCGLADLTHKVARGIEVNGVRGPISLSKCCPNRDAPAPAIGDAAMILPGLYTPAARVRRTLGLVPHYTELFRAYHQYPSEFVISPLQSVETFVDEVLSCEVIASSSLHGLVVAHAYGLKAVWVRFGDSVLGDDTKFRDHLLAMGMKPYDPLDGRNDQLTWGAMHQAACETEEPQFSDAQRERLWDALPWEVRGPVTWKEVRWL